MKKLVALLRSCVPESPSHFAELSSSLLSETRQFEEHLIEQGFVAKIEDETMQEFYSLSNFACTFENKYADKRRSIILSNARDTLLKEDYHNTIIVGSINQQDHDKYHNNQSHFVMERDALNVFHLDQCAISKTASTLITLCRKTLDEAVHQTSPPSAVPILYKTSRDLLDLFRAIIPTAHGNAIATIPRTAAVLHNDCVYLAHHLLTLGLEYKDKFQKLPLQRPKLYLTCTFVDFVPTFRDIAEQAMLDMIQRQKKQLALVVGERVQSLQQALRSNEAVTEWTEAETGVRAAHYHLHHLSQAWKPILSRDVYARSMGSLVDTFFALLLDPVVTASEISVAATHFVSSLFRDVLQAENLFLGFADEAKTYSRVWDRLTAVGRFMEMSLADISIGLSEGVFRSLTGPELSRLIHATFSDSDNRRKILQTLTTPE